MFPDLLVKCVEWSIEDVMKKHPLHYDEPLNAVLLHEITAYNLLLRTIRESLVALKQAVTGKCVP